MQFAIQAERSPLPLSFPPSLPPSSLDVPDVHIPVAPRRAARSSLARSFVALISVGDMVEHGRAA